MILDSTADVVAFRLTPSRVACGATLCWMALAGHSSSCYGRGLKYVHRIRLRKLRRTTWRCLTSLANPHGLLSSPLSGRQPCRHSVRCDADTLAGRGVCGRLPGGGGDVKGLSRCASVAAAPVAALKLGDHDAARALAAMGRLRAACGDARCAKGRHRPRAGPLHAAGRDARHYGQNGQHKQRRVQRPGVEARGRLGICNHSEPWLRLWSDTRGRAGRMKLASRAGWLPLSDQRRRTAGGRGGGGGWITRRHASIHQTKSKRASRARRAVHGFSAACATCKTSFHSPPSSRDVRMQREKNQTVAQNSHKLSSRGHSPLTTRQRLHPSALRRVACHAFDATARAAAVVALILQVARQTWSATRASPLRGLRQPASLCTRRPGRAISRRDRAGHGIACAARNGPDAARQSRPRTRARRARCAVRLAACGAPVGRACVQRAGGRVKSRAVRKASASPPRVTARPTVLAA